MRQFSEMSLEELIDPAGHECSCGRHHLARLSRVSIGPGAMDDLPGTLRELGISRPFIVSDRNTRQAAWSLLGPVLADVRIPYGEYVYQEDQVEPDEHACGSLTMAFDPLCDGIVIIGSGVLNDIGKVFAHADKLPFLVIATAPSMDGFASDSSSMIRNRVKVSLYNACPQAIIADTRILCAAPERMLMAGLGDMLAKYLSICEWRIAHLVTGEYYCENIAGLVRVSLARIVASAEGLRNREEAAVTRVMEGLVLSGIAMAYAGVSRPASGLEHYFSHMWEMMALDRGLPLELHGIQVGVGTLLTLRIWETLKSLTPSREHAERFIREFDERQWETRLRGIFGKASDQIIKTAGAERRNNPQAHARRLNSILEHWPDILRTAAEELPRLQEVESLLRRMNMPVKPADIGFSEDDTRDALIGARDIRDKYLTSSLLWDLGLLYELAFP
jgi:glycerol-1-phosphate dehydrogenase [NAD(P)+]